MDLRTCMPMFIQGGEKTMYLYTGLLKLCTFVDINFFIILFNSNICYHYECGKSS